MVVIDRFVDGGCLPEFPKARRYVQARAGGLLCPSAHVAQAAHSGEEWMREAFHERNLSQA